ncbi:HAD family hydrolase [Aliiruegeria lutimaris]|uniref:phosphoglycolate phosphatase n=1 Tax=Aliiruegeria lutimaris TaxID=571298 RepID=A0A1G8X2Y2_9RHOB|nr:HAD family hydrolase [Aliiruegeria lutimaris]SDJ85009.1 phosphoglycolate phosphatase [Aliiruegeria lutimaris]
MSEIRGLLFDKDGTLFDFQATWGGWASDLMLELGEGDEAVAEHLARRIHLNRAERQFAPESVVIAGTVDDAVMALLPGLPHLDYGKLFAWIVEASERISPAPAVPLLPLMERFRAEGIVLGVATNDAESAARVQLETIGALGIFDFVVGADSGFGAKPEPGQCLAFCEAVGLRPEQVAMIGDSTHDLHAGKAAGMVPVAVLTGPAKHEDLAPFASAVLPDIGHLPRWLAGS